MILIRPTLRCPKCGSAARSKVKLVYPERITGNLKDGDFYIEADFADELTGLTLQCPWCHHEFSIKWVNIITNEDDTVIEY